MIVTQKKLELKNFKKQLETLKFSFNAKMILQDALTAGLSKCGTVGMIGNPQTILKNLSVSDFFRNVNRFYFGNSLVIFSETTTDFKRFIRLGFFPKCKPILFWK